MTLLLKQGADVNASTANEGWSPLHEATCGGQVDLVCLLLSYHAYIHAKTEPESETPLRLAIRKGHEAVVLALLEAVAEDPEGFLNGSYDNGWRPLHYTALSGRESLTRIILEREGGMEALNVQTADGMTPLFCCYAGANNVYGGKATSKEERLRTAHWLTAKGADEGAIDRRGRTVICITQPD